MLHIRLLCFIVQAPRFHVFRNQVQLINYIERQSALFFSKMFVDHRSFFFCQKTKEISRNVSLTESVTNEIAILKPIDSFHMTSRRPYLCTKQWIGGHVSVQKNPVEIELFPYVNTSFYSKQFAKLLTT